MDNKKLKTFKSVFGQGYFMFINFLIACIIAFTEALFLFEESSTIINMADGNNMLTFGLSLALVLSLPISGLIYLISRTWAKPCFSVDSFYLYVNEKKYDLQKIATIRYSLLTWMTGPKGMPIAEPKLTVNLNNGIEVEIKRVSLIAYFILKAHLRTDKALQYKREKIKIKIKYKLLYFLPFAACIIFYIIALIIN